MDREKHLEDMVPLLFVAACAFLVFALWFGPKLNWKRQNKQTTTTAIMPEKPVTKTYGNHGIFGTPKPITK